MSTASLVARQLRLQQWADDIRDCANRPSGTTVAQWCDDHGVKKSVYYWRLRAVRNACIDSVASADLSQMDDPDEIDTSFVELSPPVQHPDKTSVQISLGAATIQLKEDIPDAFLCRIMKAVYHAQ